MSAKEKLVRSLLQRKVSFSVETIREGKSIIKLDTGWYRFDSKGQLETATWYK